MTVLQKSNSERRAIICFTKLPQSGFSKTRLSGDLPEALLRDLQWAFLEDLAAVFQAVPADLFVAFTAAAEDRSSSPGADAIVSAPAENKEDTEDTENTQAIEDPEDTAATALARLKRIFSSARDFFPQQGQGIGERMDNAMRWVFQKGYTAVLLTGSDLPALRPWHLQEAFAALSDVDLVLGPSLDGGYYLIASRAPVPALFSGPHFGTGRVLEETLARAAAAGLHTALAPHSQDVDTLADLQSFLKNHRSDKSATLRCLRPYLRKLEQKDVVSTPQSSMSAADRQRIAAGRATGGSRSDPEKQHLLSPLPFSPD